MDTRRGIVSLIIAASTMTGAVAGELHLTVHESSGAPVPFRAYFYGEKGVITSEAVLSYSKRSTSEETHLICDGELDIELEPGTYTIRIERGLEWIPVKIDSEHIHVVMNPHMDRWVNMNARGWYSGDMHVHRDRDGAIPGSGGENSRFSGPPRSSRVLH